MAVNCDTLTFFVNGRMVMEREPDPEATLLQYLRRKLHLTGTKEGCGHGGCGSCTVMVSKFNSDTKKIVHYSVNACLFPLCGAQGLAITTVEGVGNTRTGLHDVQKKLIESQGLQCGFCTPGFVMSMFVLLRNNPTPSKDDIEKAIEGNLCRCTGYRPIVEAFQEFAQDENKQNGCIMGEQCCKNLPEVIDPIGDSKGERIYVPKDDSQVAIFPPELKLAEVNPQRSMTFKGGNCSWFVPASLEELLSLKQKYPSAHIVMGNTRIAYLIKMHKKLGEQFYLINGGGLPELKFFKLEDTGMKIGAGLTFSELETELQSAAVSLPEEKQRFIPAFLHMIHRYGSDQIRNVATLGGNIAARSSNFDFVPLLTAVGAAVVTISSDCREEKKHFLNGHRVYADSEIIHSVVIPYSTKNDYLEFAKHADRRTFSLAIANAGMFAEFDEGGKTVKSLKLCFGGLGATPLSLDTSAVTGIAWNEELLNKVLNTISRDLLPVTEQKQNGYKLSLASAFFFKFYMKVFSQVSDSQESMDDLNDLPMGPCEGVQVYQEAPKGQALDDPVWKPVPNIHSESIVTGEAMFLDDSNRYDNELFLACVRSSRAHARILDVDVSEALKVPGVHSYINHKDIPGINLFGSSVADEEIFASKEVTCYGQTIGGILAETREAARKAASLVKVNYEDLDTILTMQEAISANSMFCGPLEYSCGDVEHAFGESDFIIDGEIETGLQEHFYMETQSAFVNPRLENEEFDIYVPTQDLTGTQAALSQILNIERNRIKVHTKRCGGAFGGKAQRHMLVLAPAAVAAYKTKQPVRCILSREEDMQVSGKRNPCLGRYKVGFEKTGRVKAVEVQLYMNGGNTLDESKNVMIVCILGFEGGYKIPNLKLTGHVCKTNIPSNCAFRGFGNPQGGVIMEDIMFQIASALGKPQDEVRYVNLYKEGETTPGNFVLENCTIRECWELCHSKSKFEERSVAVQKFNKDHRWKKRGITITPVKLSAGLGPNFMYQGIAMVSIYLDGSVLVCHGGIEMGQGINTKLAQVASRALEIPLKRIIITEADSNVCPNVVHTGGSSGTDVFGTAVLDACNTLMRRLEPYKQNAPSSKWEDMVRAAYFDRVQLSATGFSSPKVGESFDFEKKRGHIGRYFVFGAACSEVELDCLTGETQILQTDIVMDVGKSINPMIDIGQIEGGFVQAQGLFTTEYIKVEKNGRLQNCSPLNYKIPNVRSVPRKFNVTLLKNDRLITPIYSAKGIGEPPMMLALSAYMAIKEAIKSARAGIGLEGYFRLDCPATVERIHEACGKQLHHHF
ncbi:hypothetical protein ACJMK2_022415 [Sinanodonta woodiana]|uniref:Xanthine dehydrogenase n=1 Tax=Sinanodonta woodiana TaxID=1069815 RepID=A0ABD3TIZ6_SINWO